MSIRLKLLSAITITLLCLGGVAILGRSSMRDAEQAIARMLDRHMAAVQQARSAQLAFAQADRALGDARAAATLSQADTAAEVFRDRIAAFSGAWGALQAVLDDAGALDTAAQIGTRAAAWQDRAAGLLTGGMAISHLAQRATLERQRDELWGAIDRLVADTTTRAREDAARELASLDARASNFMVLAAIAAAAGARRPSLGLPLRRHLASAPPARGPPASPPAISRRSRQCGVATSSAACCRRWTACASSCTRVPKPSGGPAWRRNSAARRRNVGPARSTS